MDATMSISGESSAATPLSQLFRAHALRLATRSLAYTMARPRSETERIRKMTTAPAHPAAVPSKTTNTPQAPENLERRPHFLDHHQQVFGESNASAWGFISQHRDAVQKAAQRIAAVEVGEEQIGDEAEGEDPEQYRLSPLERLPDEILMQIMKHLDNESLYRLSQATPFFLDLSFDPAFESRPDWRAFRHTVDGLGDGPRKRVSEALTIRPRIEDAVQRPAEKSTGKVAGEPDEGETMISFMAREFGL
ncbi:hypothetical protein F4779DRAFT_212218 [Xylariaceae sp. FL0662B]|nr:hypothetical protein F4779DRAFT_212218 [Xylariaceae sp. FL0662B]